GQRVVEVMEAAVVAEALAVEQAPDDLDGLRQAIETLAGDRAAVERERSMLLLDPAAADAEDRPSATDVVDGRRHLRDESRVAERVRAHEMTDPRPGRDRGHGRQRRPALELRSVGVALVVEEVIVDP